MNPLLESDEMFTQLLYKYGRLTVAQFGTQTTKVVKEKDFMKNIGQEKKKNVASYIKEEKKEQFSNDNLSLQEALLIKKDRSKMQDSYQPGDVEKYWYQYWETNKYFVADAQRGLQTEKKYIIMFPPPNVTGYLHLGHALTTAIEDSLVRYHRMKGFEVCFVPGTDHAGIATQSVVEKNILKTEGLTKDQVGREPFLEKVWQWKEKQIYYTHLCKDMLRKTATSFDWDRYYFTMDANLQVSVTEAFVRLYEKGLIYRANRLVNWSSILRTAISDIEVEYIDLDQPIKRSVPGHSGNYEFGYLTHFAYKVKDSNEEIVVATTRLETMLGDVAVAVNSKDPRYQHLHGKHLVHPFLPDRQVIVIVDDELVDMNFGTGAVKVTPAHDPNDFDCGVRHKLEQITIFDVDGTINKQGGPYSGLMRFDARVKMEEDMKTLGIFRKKVPNKMRIGICSRSKDIIEPMVKPQWYINCQTVRQPMIDAVKNKSLQIIPSNFENDWFRWLDGMRDWCISRQLWWGHRCPAYMATVPNHVSDPTKGDDWIIARNLEEAFQKAEKKYNIPRDQIQLRQDDDVLDTWFSSGLIPFSSLGWPNAQSPDLKAFFPNTILETGWDILFFWVARMVQMSLWLMDTLPFKHVFLHPIIRDKDGKKMSKSSGNVIDPIEVIQGTTLENLKQKVLEGNLPKGEVQRTIEQKEKDFPQGIPECGSDALRFGLLAYLQKTSNINLDILQIIGYRQFCNKIWNTVKYGLSKLPNEIPNYSVTQQLSLDGLALINQWILVKLNQTTQQITQSFELYEFGVLTQSFQGFWLYQLSDVYLEAIKYVFTENNKDEALKQQTIMILFTVLETGLRLLHPMMPFLSEELWQKLPSYPGKADSLCITRYPEPSKQLESPQVEEDFEVLESIARSLRQISAAANLPPNSKPEAYILIQNDKHIEELIVKAQNVLTAISRTKSVEVISQVTEQHQQCGQGTVGEKIQLFVNLKQHIKLDAESQRLDKKLQELLKFIQNLEKKISQYSDKVPEKVRLEDTQKMEKYLKEKEVIQQQIAQLKLMH